MKTIAAVLMLSVIFCMSAFAGTWEKQSQGWVYWQDDGNVAIDTWITDDDGSSYYVGSNGVMATNTWMNIGDKWYYLGGDGTIMRGTVLDLGSGNTLYLLGDDGAMLTNTWYELPDGKGDWYYFGPDGLAYKGGWYNINGDDYYFMNNCKMAHSTIDGLNAVVGGGAVGADGKRVK